MATEAQRLFDEGMQLYQQDTTKSLLKAISKWQQALPLWRKIEDNHQEALTLFAIGLVYDHLEEKQKALDYYYQALPIFRFLQYGEGEAKTLYNIGRIYFLLGKKQKALDYYYQALPIFQAIEDRQREAKTLRFIHKIKEESILFKLLFPHT